MDGLLCLAPIGDGAGAGHLLEDCCFLADTATEAGMLLGLVMVAGAPGGGGAGRLPGIKRGGGGRGGRDLPFSLILLLLP